MKIKERNNWMQSKTSRRAQKSVFLVKKINGQKKVHEKIKKERKDIDPKKLVCVKTIKQFLTLISLKFQQILSQIFIIRKNHLKMQKIPNLK